MTLKGFAITHFNEIPLSWAIIAGIIVILLCILAVWLEPIIEKYIPEKVKYKNLYFYICEASIILFIIVAYICFKIGSSY